MEPSLLIFFTIVVGIPVAGGIAMSAFQRWLLHKEKMGALIASETAEKAAQYAAHVERIEARLRVVEEIVTDGGQRQPRKSKHCASRGLRPGRGMMPRLERKNAGNDMTPASTRGSPDVR